MPIRFADVGQNIYDFGDVFWVQCPRCQWRARVAAVSSANEKAPGWLFGPRRLTCKHCSLSKDCAGNGFGIGRQPEDWYFGLSLWLQTPCCGQVLWAYNERHLAFLEQYVGATLRETTLEAGNRSLASRLPRWIKSGQHREEVLAGLRRLRALLEE